MDADVLRESEGLHARVRAFAASAEHAAERFDTLAHELVAFQARHVRPFARLLAGVGASPGAPLSTLPGLPTDVYRLARVAAHPPERDVVVFRTSGTSAGARGVHALRTTETYRAVALAWGRSMLFPDVQRMDVVVLRDPTATDSSLGFMMELFAAELGGEVVRPLRPDGELLTFELAQVRALGARPVLVMGASFAFVHLLDREPSLRLPLPEGSRVMQTGGFKGRSREVDAGELRAAIARCFSVPEELVVSEYGMTELTSQAYEPCVRDHLGRSSARGSPDRTAESFGAAATSSAAPRGVHALPPWMRADTVAPDTLEPLPSGARGLVRLFDLANVDSCCIVQTSDLGVVDERGGVRVLGRLAGATSRGCSLAMDEALG